MEQPLASTTSPGSGSGHSAIPLRTRSTSSSRIYRQTRSSSSTVNARSYMSTSSKSRVIRTQQHLGPTLCMVFVRILQGPQMACTQETHRSGFPLRHSGICRCRHRHGVGCPDANPALMGERKRAADSNAQADQARLTAASQRTDSQSRLFTRRSSWRGRREEAESRARGIGAPCHTSR